MNPNPGTHGENRVCGRCDSGITCWNGPTCKWYNVGSCRFRHDNEDDGKNPRVEGGLSCIMRKLDEIIQLLRERLPTETRQESQSNGKVSNTMTDLPDSHAKPSQALAIEAPPARQEGVDGTDSWHSLTEPSDTIEIMKCGDKSSRSKLKRPYRAVSVAWRGMKWDWLESDVAAWRKQRLCSKGRATLEQWRKVCTKSRPKGPTMHHWPPDRHKLEDDQSSESDEEFDDDENWEYDEDWMSEMRRKYAMNSDDEYMLK